MREKFVYLNEQFSVRIEYDESLRKPIFREFLHHHEFLTREWQKFVLFVETLNLFVHGKMHKGIEYECLDFKMTFVLERKIPILQLTDGISYLSYSREEVAAFVHISNRILSRCALFEEGLG